MLHSSCRKKGTRLELPLYITFLTSVIKFLTESSCREDFGSDFKEALMVRWGGRESTSGYFISSTVTSRKR